MGNHFLPLLSVPSLPTNPEDPLNPNIPFPNMWDAHKHACEFGTQLLLHNNHNFDNNLQAALLEPSNVAM